MLASEKVMQQPEPHIKTIALVGNPNTGKTSIFNRLTGTRQHVGNYPGVTVEKKEGRMLFEGEQLSVVDLPGTYSLSAQSADERVVVDFLSGRMPGMHKPDLVVCVLDATNLFRNLYLPSQIADTGLPMVLALNMADEARAQGLKIDCEELSKRLGIPVVPTAAPKGEGLLELRKAIFSSLNTPRSMARVSWPVELEEAFEELLDKVASQKEEKHLNEAELHRLLFDENTAICEHLNMPQTALNSVLRKVQNFLKDNNINPQQAEPLVRYGWIEGQLQDICSENLKRQRKFSLALDALLTHRVFGLIIFVTVMYLVFQSIYTFAGPFMDFIDKSFGSLGEWFAAILETHPMLQSFVVDGVIAGVGGVMIFLPQILILFLFIALLEDSGYMARAAFLMDKIFGWCGLNGKSFVPMLSSYACAIPGIMAARTIEDPKARLTTILIAPLMSCSARLPVYVLLIGAFIEPVYGVGWAAFSLFAIHFIGLLVAIPAAYLLNRFVLKGERQPFILEMPPYRRPSLRDMLWRLYDRGKVFLIRAGTVIFCMSVIIWALSYFPRPAELESQIAITFTEQLSQDEGVSITEAQMLVEGKYAGALAANVQGAYLEQSYIGQMGKFLQPVFAPAGFDWKITVGILASFPAREVIISTLGIIYNLGGDTDEESQDLISTLKAETWPDGSPVFNVLVAISIMVFFALCMQCGATLATIERESNWKWAVFAFVYMTALAWLGAVVVYQGGSILFPELLS